MFCIEARYGSKQRRAQVKLQRTNQVTSLPCLSAHARVHMGLRVEVHLEASGCTELYIGTGSDHDPDHLNLAAPKEVERTALPMSHLKMWLRRCSTGQDDHAVARPTTASQHIQRHLSDLHFQHWLEAGRLVGRVPAYHCLCLFLQQRVCGGLRLFALAVPMCIATSLCARL